MKRKNIIIVAVLVAMASAAVAAFFGMRYYITFKRANVAETAVLLVNRNSDFRSVLDSIEKSGALKNLRSFERAAAERELEKHFEPGRYVLKPGMSNQYIIRMIANAWQTPVKVTLTGYIKTLPGVAAFLGRNFEADSTEFAVALSDSALRNSFGFEPRTYISMFIPNTYEMYWTASPEEVLRRFKKEYDTFWEGARDGKAKAMGMSREEVMTLASIVISETNNQTEMPKIAGVYVNRLKKRMPLQACPTVIYAHLDSEPGLRRVLNRHLQIDSPYNTYKHTGLPPGPIAIPTVAAIDAVLDYSKTKYLYFCAKPEFDGTHNFAETYTEHRKNSEAYNKALTNRI